MDPQTGGVCQAVRSIIHGLQQRGIINEVACLDHFPKPNYFNDEFEVHAFGTGKGPWKYNPTLRNWLHSHMSQYDLVIVHGLWQYHTYAVYQASKLKNLNAPRIFVMPHGMLDPWFQKISVRPVKAIRNWLFWLFAERHLINSADGLIFTCEIEKELSRIPFKPYKPHSERVAGLGVHDVPVFQESMSQAFQNKVDINGRPFYLFLSRISEKKGVDLLIESYTTLCTNWKDLDNPPPVLVIAGPLDSGFATRMQSLADEKLRNNALGKIIFAGMLSGEAKWGAFYGCEAFVLPSHQENFGIAVVEALACGTPVLISNQVNIWKEILADNAAIVARDTLEGTTELFERWTSLSNTEQLAMKTNAKNCFASRFTIDASSKVFLEQLSYGK
ncbi:glycosyltransferase [Luteolibacter pohnpeiensis]|uniref:Glycosyltransferase n=1 Tax=Luteolibacter pohnpeiensis TaxID=454153 RepID=A0A934SAY4_9BACT|nr:glycosyltransferase [Luteolibacter pohnpeiensis]MBK1882852.1 glycosyltransferase [Luteolibacter pohnpeiensis]